MPNRKTAKIEIRNLKCFGIIAREIAVKTFTVVLLFFLNMREGVAESGAFEFENRGIVDRRNVLFHCEGILNKVTVVLLIRGCAG